MLKYISDVIGTEQDQRRVVSRTLDNINQRKNTKRIAETASWN
jgi:hypothetical protein